MVGKNSELNADLQMTPLLSGKHTNCQQKNIEEKKRTDLKLASYRKHPVPENIVVNENTIIEKYLNFDATLTRAQSLS